MLGWSWLWLPAWLALLCALAHCLSWLLSRRSRRLLAPLPQLPTLPLLGNIHQLLGDGAHLFKSLQMLTRVSEETGKPFVAWIGPFAAILVSDPEDVKAVNNAFVEKPYFYGFAKDWVGNGLVTAPGYLWKRNIKMLAGTFNTAVVEGYQAVFDANAALLVQRLRASGANHQPLDMFHHLSYSTLETICQTALGVSEVSSSVDIPQYHEALSRTLQLITNRAMNILYHVDALYRLTPQHRELSRCVQVLHRASRTIMEKRMQQRLAMKKNGELDNEINNSKNGSNRFKSFLDILLELGEAEGGGGSMTPQQVLCEIDTIIFGGLETVSTTLFLMFLLVGSMPHVQRKMVDELREIFGGRGGGGVVTRADLRRMRYCEAVLQETLRLYPPMPVLLREADRQLRIKSCTIPKGVTIGINAWAAGRSERAWGADALAFRPERWLTDGDGDGHGHGHGAAGGNSNPAAFLAFSYGRRACIGKKYAYAIMKTIVAHVLRELEVSADIGAVTFKVEVSLKAVSGHLVTLRPRDHRTAAALQS